MSTQLIKPNYLVILPPTQHHIFFRNLPPLFSLSLFCVCLVSITSVSHSVFVLCLFVSLVLSVSHSVFDLCLFVSLVLRQFLTLSLFCVCLCRYYYVSVSPCLCFLFLCVVSITSVSHPVFVLCLFVSLVLRQCLTLSLFFVSLCREYYASVSLCLCFVFVCLVSITSVSRAVFVLC